jgi:hypothetical protein
MTHPLSVRLTVAITVPSAPVTVIAFTSFTWPDSCGSRRSSLPVVPVGCRMLLMPMATTTASTAAPISTYSVFAFIACSAP